MTGSNTLKKTLVFVFFVTIFSKNFGQDLHYSQFYHSPQNINPALTGLFDGDHRFYGSFRDQWRFVPVPWFTFSGAYDRKLFVLGDKQFLGIGGIINHDRQGDSKFNLTSISVNAALHRFLSQHHIIGIGAVLGFASRGFNTTNLTWDKQWNGDSFDPNLPSGEQFDLLRTNFIENGLGLNYRYQKDERTHVDLGASVLHLIEPQVSHYDADNIKLPRRITFSGVGNFKLTSKLDLQLHGLHQLQGKYNETIFGGLAKIYIKDTPGKRYQLHLGLGYRTAKSFIPTVALQYNEILASFSYDVDRNAFNDILNSNRGGPELHVRYIIKKVKPLSEIKVCPIY